MASFVRGIDWPVLAGGFLGCYILPTFIFGTAFPYLAASDAGVAKWVAVSFLIVCFAGQSPLAGYIAARYAKNRPRLHAFLVGILALCLWYIPFYFFVPGGKYPIWGLPLFVAFTLVCNGIGATIWLRRRGQGDPT
jgi:hypothetical protein